MSDIAEVSPVTDALLSALRTETGKQIGDAKKPDSPNPPPTSFYPYAILYVGTPALTGSFVHPNEDGIHRAQVTSVAKERRGAEWMRDRAREVLLDADLAIEGYAVVWSELESAPPITRDDDVSPPLFYAVDIFRLHVTPLDSGS